MADTKISADDPAGSLTGAESFPLLQGGANKKVLLSVIATYINSLVSIAFSSLTGKPTTLSGYGITDAAPAAPNVQSVTSSATVTPTFSNDQVNITAQAAGLTLANPSGTAVPAWGIVIRIKDNGTARSISYGTQYRAVGVTLPTTTVISKVLYLGCIWNDTATKLDVVAVAQEA